MKRAVIPVLLILLFTRGGMPVMAAVQRQVPAPAAVVMNRAEHLLASGKIQESIDLLESFQEKRKTVSPVAAESRGYTHYLIDFLLGNCYLMLEKPAEAVQHFQEALDRHPDFTEARFNLARGLYALGQSTAAGRQFVAAYETPGGKKADALYYAAVCFMQAKDYPQALAIFERLLKEHPGELTIEWRQTLARLYLVTEMPDRALPHVRILADQTTGTRQREWRETLIYLYLQLNQRDRALASVVAFKRDDPLEPKWWRTHAWLLLEKQDYRQALAALIAFGYLKPLSDEERVLLGDVNLMAGIPVEAVRNYETELMQKPEPDLVKKTAQGYLRLYDDKRALEWIERGLKQAPSDKDLLKMKGYLLYQAGRLADAADVYGRLADLSPQSGDPWLMQGYIAWRRGEISQAKKAFTRAEEFDDCADRARKALAQLR